MLDQKLQVPFEGFNFGSLLWGEVPCFSKEGANPYAFFWYRSLQALSKCRWLQDLIFNRTNWENRRGDITSDDIALLAKCPMIRYLNIGFPFQKLETRAQKSWLLTPEEIREDAVRTRMLPDYQAVQLILDRHPGARVHPSPPSIGEYRPGLGD